MEKSMGNDQNTQAAEVGDISKLVISKDTSSSNKVVRNNTRDPVIDKYGVIHSIWTNARRERMQIEGRKPRN